jgi:hypothetical protein
MRGVTSQGSPLTRYRRAVRSGNPTLVLAAAAEMQTVALDDALQLCLVLIRAGDRRASAALVRWHGRYCLEVRPQPDEAQLLLAALRALGGPTEAAAGEALAALFEQRDLRELSRALDEWLPD